jgi:lysyl-tRNA synthetase class 1
MLHWADRTAEELISARPDVDVYTCASGISPSGSIHIGNVRDIATILFVGRALKDRGKRVRLIHSWDDYDRLRKIPRPKTAGDAGLPSWLEERAKRMQIPESFEEHLGRPLASVPDPLGEFESYADRFEKEFEGALIDLGVETEIEILRQSVKYPSGVYRDAILEAVAARHLIYDIISSFRTQDPTAEEREAFLPVTVYCSGCNRDSTKASLVPGSDSELRVVCGACKFEETLDLREANNVKLPWKVDWAMRWRHEGVVFEPFGKDHATAGGSFEVSSEIARRVYGYEPPVPQPYEFIGIKGLTGKMSGSTGLLLTPADLLTIYQPEVMLWMYARVAPMKSFDVAVDDQVLRMYDEFDRALVGDPQVETDTRSLELARTRDRQLRPVPFRQLTGFCGIVQGNADALERIFETMGTPYSKADFEERLHRAENWLERFMPAQRIVIRESRNDAAWATVADDERAWIRSLVEWLEKNPTFTIEEATEAVYAIPKREGQTDKEQGAAQKRFFQIVYALVFGATRGPRLGTFLAVVPAERYIALLRFTEHD